MIRLIQRRLIIPRGDTGSFSIPVLSKGVTNNIAVFTIFDEITHTKMFQKMVPSEGDVLNIAFTHSDTVNLKPGKYVWDIKYYSNPEFIDDELVNGEEIDSYYAGFSLPVCEIRETADSYLVSPEAPTATLSPQQLDIVTNAIHSLNEAIRKTQENVEHYPEIRDEVWYAWDAELGDYVSTGVSANGIVGNGIASAVLNNDYTLTLNFTDGTSFTSPSIRGETGNGIDDIVLNNDFTLTISYTDGESYTTPSIRGPIGPTPQFSIGTVQDGAVAAASITGTAENPVLNLTLPNANVPTRVSELENDSGYLTEHQDLSNYVQKTDYATSSNAGIVKIGAGLSIDGSFLTLYKASNNQIKQGTASYSPIVPSIQERSTFYGLAKAAGDTTQSQSSNAIGTYTDEAKAAIQTMLDVPSNADVAAKQDALTFDNTPTANSTNPVTSGGVYSAISNINTMSIHICTQDEYNAETGVPTIQNPDTQTFYLVPGGEGSNLFIEWAYVNNAWERFGSADVDLSNYVQKTDYATTSEAGIVKVGNGLAMSTNGTIGIQPAPSVYIKAGDQMYNPISPKRQHEATFYGLAKAAGDSTQSSSSNAVGTYTDEAKAAIQQMLDVPNKAALDTKAPVIYKIVTGSSLTITDAIPNLPLKSLILTITGDPTDVGTTSASVVVSPSTTAAEGTTYTKSFDAIYEGTLDFISGKLTITKTILDLGSIGYNYNNDYHYFFSQALYGIIDTNEPIYSSDLTVVTPEEIQAGTEGVAFGGATYIYVYNNNYVGMTIDEFKAAVAGKCIAYSLRTPRVVQLSAEDIRALSGTTYISSEDGNLNVEYLVDTKSYIDTGIENIDLSGFATKADTVLDTTLSLGRRPWGAIGESSIALGKSTMACDIRAFSTGFGGAAIGKNSFVEGLGSILTASITGPANSKEYVSSKLFPIGTVCYIFNSTEIPPVVLKSEEINGNYILTFDKTLDENAEIENKTFQFHTHTAIGLQSHAEGRDTISFNPNQHVEGAYNIPHTSALHVVGNGINNDSRSNAYALTWTGDGKYAGDVYVHANADSSGGTKLATIEDIPEVPVQDVQIDGTSILQDGVANVPLASMNNLGVVQCNPENGINTDSNGNIKIVGANASLIKTGSNGYRPIIPAMQHTSTFYGLSKVAGVDLANETVTLGTYPETSKTAIRSMIGAASTNVIAVQDTQPTDADTKIWLSETAETPVQVPTVAEMNAALAMKMSAVFEGDGLIITSAAEFAEGGTF